MRPLHTLIIAAALAAAPIVGALAQGPSPAFMKWRDQHKYTFQLRTMLTAGIAECERSKSTAIKPDQAKKILGVLMPLTKKPKLTQDEAKLAIQKLQLVYEARQLTSVDKVLKASANRRPGGGAPGGAPGGGSPGGAARPPFDPTRMKNFNPFNPEKSSPMYERSVDRNKKLIAFLQARSTGKAAKFDAPTAGGR